MEYGTLETTHILDNNGSTVTKEVNYVKSETNKPVRNKYRIKKRVHNQREEHEAYIEFSNDISRDKSKLDPAFQIERTKLGNDNGYYYVVLCYTQLEY